MLTKSEAFIPTHFAQELFWKVKLTQQEISVRHSEPISLQKDGLLLKDNWGLSEENAGEWQSSRLLPNFAFFGPQGPGMQARLIFGIREQSEILGKVLIL